MQVDNFIVLSAAINLSTRSALIASAMHWVGDKLIEFYDASEPAILSSSEVKAPLLRFASVQAFSSVNPPRSPQSLATALEQI